MKKISVAISLVFCIRLYSTVQTPTASPHIITLVLQSNYTKIEQLTQQKPPTTMSQSDGHAYANYAAIQAMTTRTWRQFDMANAEVQRCFSAAYAQEVAENARGCYTFFHAQQWSCEWLATLYKTLYEAVTEESVPAHYQFVRFKDPQSLQEDETAVHKKLKKGDAQWEHERYLFMNAALFGNAERSGECSASYWFANRSIRSTERITNKKLFSRCGLHRFYKKYRHELEQLQKEHAQLTTRGNLLLISLSAAYCTDYVIESVGRDGIVSTPQGDVKSAPAMGQAVLDKLTQLKKNPTLVVWSDKLIYRLILMRNTTLTPSDNIKIFAFNGIEPTKWKAFCAKRNALFARIKQDIHTTKFATTS